MHENFVVDFQRNIRKTLFSESASYQECTNNSKRIGLQTSLKSIYSDQKRNLRLLNLWERYYAEVCTNSFLGKTRANLNQSQLANVWEKIKKIKFQNSNTNAQIMFSNSEFPIFAKYSLIRDCLSFQIPKCNRYRKNY